MNIPLDRGLSARSRRTLSARIEEAIVVAIGDTLSAIVFDRFSGHRARILAKQDGQPIARPFMTAEFLLASGGTRHVLLVPQAIAEVLARHTLLQFEDGTAAEIDPRWLQMPKGELSTLTNGLSAHGISRLLRVTLTTAASLFSAESQAGLADAIAGLMELCEIAACPPISQGEIYGRLIITYALPGASALQVPTHAVAVADGKLIQLGNLDCLANGDLLHVMLPKGHPVCEIVAFADGPLWLAAPSRLVRKLAVPALINAYGKAHRDWLCERIGDTDEQRPGAAMVAELTEPQVIVRHLSASSAGLLHLLRLEDPSRLVYKVILKVRGLQTELAPVHATDGKATLAGLCDLAYDTHAGETCQIRVLLHSGRLRLLGEVSLKQYDGGIPTAFVDDWESGQPVLDALAQARARFRRPAITHLTHHFGIDRKCALRIVTPMGNSADMIRARAAIILAEARKPPVEVICTMPDGPLTSSARRVLADTTAIYKVPHRLVLLPSHATASERLRAALSETPDLPTLILGDDVLPDQLGWLAFWLKRLRRHDALAPLLLACDGAVAATQEGLDPFRGLPATDLPRPGRTTDRPLAACLALGPAGIARLLQSGTPHPDPALWIASALRGAARTEVRHPFRVFGRAHAPQGFAAVLQEAGFTQIAKERN